MKLPLSFLLLLILTQEHVQQLPGLPQELLPSQSALPFEADSVQQVLLEVLPLGGTEERRDQKKYT